MRALIVWRLQWCLEEWQWWKQATIIMAFWFTDPLAREVEPTKIPGVTATTVLVVLASSVLVWQCSSNIGYLGTSQLKDSNCIMELVLVEVQYWNTTGLLTTLSTTRPLQSTVFCVCRVVGREFTGVGKPHDKPEGDDVNL